MKVLVPNIGSTSLKWRLFDFGALGTGEARLLHRGGLERVTDYARAVDECLRQLRDAGAVRDERDVAAIGFKTIIARHVTGCVRIDEDVLEAMDAFSGLAPAHNPPYIAGIRTFARRMPGVPLVALFETAFYQFAPDRMMRYAVPASWHDAGVRRWGFHGASHKFLAERSADLLGRPDVAERVRELYAPSSFTAIGAPPSIAHALRATPVGLAAAQNAAGGACGPREDSESARGGGAPHAPIKVITCHLGGSSSVTGTIDGVAIGNSLGMSPQSGVPQNNRVGDLDSAALPHAMRALGLSLSEAEGQLARESGLQGLSELSNDVRDLECAAADGHAGAALALDVYITSIRHWIGAYFLELNGADALVFAGGIGEHSAFVREQVCANLEGVGIALDRAANSAGAAGERRISRDDSRVQVWVIPTNEELVVARETARLLTSLRERSDDDVRHDTSFLQPLTQD